MIAPLVEVLQRACVMSVPSRADMTRARLGPVKRKVAVIYDD